MCRCSAAGHKAEDAAHHARQKARVQWKLEGSGSAPVLLNLRMRGKAAQDQRMTRELLKSKQQLNDLTAPPRK